MDDLIRRAKSKVEEPGNWNHWDEIQMAECIADIMYFIQWRAGCIQMLFRSDDVDVLSVVDCLAYKGYVLKRENSPFHRLYLLWATQSMCGLPVESALAKDRANESTRFQVVANLFK